jgi:hypothetical protein
MTAGRGFPKIILMDEHDLMAGVFRSVLTEHRHEFRNLGTYTNEWGRKGFRRFAIIANETIYLTESDTAAGGTSIC